jgi:PAS domain S-box-containing protein
VGIVGIFHALRVAELKARRSQERLGTFAAATFEGIVESERGQIVDCNEQFAQMTGRPVAELKGAAIADLIAPEDRERVMASIGANREAVLEHSVVRTDGARIVVEAHGRPAAPGSSRRYTAVRDITARKRAEEAIRRIAQFPEENPNPVLRVAADGALMYANAPARALLGACGAAADSSPPEPLAALATEAAQQGRVIERELPVPDGRTFWWGATRPAGEDYVNLYARDITKRKRAEERLRVQIEHMPIACILHDTEFRFTGWNPAAEEIFGFSAAEAIGKHPCDLIVPPQARTHVRQVLARLGTGEAEVESLNENLTKDGRTILCRWTNTPVRDAAGRIVGCLSMAEDVTETIRSRQALLQSREDMDRAQAVAHMGSWRLDVQTNVLFWSEEAWRIFGLPKGTPLTYETFLGTVHTDDRAYVHEKWSAGLRGEPYDIEHRIIVGDAVKWVREKAYLEFDPDGTLRGGFGIVQDITARKAMEDELRRAHDELEMRVRERTAELLETVRQLEAEQAVTERAKALAEVTAHLLRLFTEKTSQKERL